MQAHLLVFPAYCPPLAGLLRVSFFGKNILLLRPLISAFFSTFVPQCGYEHAVLHIGSEVI